MYSLLIDTHSNEMNLVLYKDHIIVNKLSEINNNQSKIIIVKIQELLQNNYISLDDIKEVVVVNGPGSFTGVRIGVTIAKTLSYTLNIPIYSISSLQLKALSNTQDNSFSTTIKDNKGYYIGEFDNNNMIEAKYIDNSLYKEYEENHLIINSDIDWSLLYQSPFLKEEDCYNIKPIYIKKIEVEK